MTFFDWVMAKKLVTRKISFKWAFEHMDASKLSKIEFRKRLTDCQLPANQKGAIWLAWAEWKKVKPVMDRITAPKNDEYAEWGSALKDSYTDGITR